MERARTFGIGLAAATLAIGLGLVVLWILGAPRSYLILNALGLAAGALLGGLLLLRPGFVSRSLVVAALAGGSAVLLTAYVGVPLEGIRRWLRLGPVLVHVGLLTLPFVLALASRQPGLWSAVAVALALLGAALQPDAQMATALTAGLLAIAVLRPSRRAWLVPVLAIATALWCWTRFDPLPAVTYVEGVVPLALGHSGALGVLAGLGVALPALALVAFGLVDRARRVTAIALAAGCAGAALAALVGKYPTPLVGYGLSPILSYILCWAVLAGLPRTRRQVFAG